MPLNLRASRKITTFNVPVSFKIHDKSGKFLDARNVNSIQDRLDTRFGTSRFNATPLDGPVKSISFFSKSNGEKYTLAKVGTDLVSVKETGGHTIVKSGLDPNEIHRAVTGNDRHIISHGKDGLFSWDGQKFNDLGQEPPEKPSVSVIGGGNLAGSIKYRVAISFYAESIGFESGYSESDIVETSTINKQILVSNIPTSAINTLVNTVYVYLKNVTTNGPYLLFQELQLGTTSVTIGEEPSSSQTVQTAAGKPKDGGGKFLTFFNSRLVVGGNNNYPNEIYFSEPDLPDAFDEFDTGLTLVIPGRGPVTGIAVGLFNDSVLDPFLVIFKGKSTRVYSEIGDMPKMVTLSDEIGCVSHETIQVKNGVVYFLSEEGWRAIANGRFITNKSGEPITLANGDIDDIFKSTGFSYEVNRQGLAKAFSVYYPTLDQYITWVSEGTSNEYSKAYVYEFDIGGFKPYEFKQFATCAALGENSRGRDQVLLGTSSGYILKHSISEQKSDVDVNGNPSPINAFGVLPYIPEEDGDFDATYNYRELILKAIASSKPLTVKTFLDYDLSTELSGTYEFNNPIGGFILDESMLDVGILNDDRASVTARSDINRVGESLAIGFYQNEINSNIGLISMQIDLSKNGNRNRPKDNYDGEGGFNYEDETYYPSVSESVQLAADYLKKMQELMAQFEASGGNVVFTGWSERFNEPWSSNGIQDTFAKIIKINYQAPAVVLSASGSGTVREKGQAVTSSSLVASVTKRSDNINRITFYLNGVAIPGADFNPPSVIGSGSTAFNWTGSFSDNSTFRVDVTDNGESGGPSTVSSSAPFTFVYPYFHGAGAPGLSASAVSGLTKSVITSNANLNRVFTTANGQVYYFAYPASYGALTAILDENGFETIGDWTLRTQNITGLDGVAVSYRIYEFNNPVVAGSTNYTFKR